jgi:PAS domain S-box-containing protein
MDPSGPEQLRALFDASPWPMWVFDRQTLAFLRVNDAAVRDYGWTRDELLRMTICDIRPPEDVAALREVAHLPASDRNGSRGSWRHLRKDGTLREVVVHTHDLALDGRAATLVLVRDVTEERAGERALRRSEESFRAAIEASPDLVAVAREGRLAYVNPAVVAALGIDARRLLGRPIAVAIAPDDLPAAEALLASAWRGDRAAAIELRLLRADGSHLLAEVSAVRVEFQGQPALLAFGRDIGERRRLEAQLATAHRMSSLGTLAAGVAHEINNPISYALSNLGFVADGVAPLLAGARDGGEIAAALREARHGLERVRDIVRDLKIFSRPDDAPMGPVDLHALLDTACGMAAAEIRHRARLVKDYAPGPFEAHGSAGKLAQVFVNLLVNAAQAIPEGAVAANQVTVATSRLADGRVAVEVRDTGRGIAAEHLPLLFDPFFTTKPTGVGTGLGLSICHGIVRAHGGVLEVESAAGRGACFRVVLAAARPRGIAAGEARAPGKTPPPAAQGPSRRSVLVVDDERLVCDAVARALGPQHDVVKANGMARALEILRGGRRFDAILSDVMMPEATGVQFHATLARELPDQARRLAFITAGVFSDEARRLVRDTGRPVVEKPFTREALLACVRALLAG